MFEKIGQFLGGKSEEEEYTETKREAERMKKKAEEDSGEMKTKVSAEKNSELVIKTAKEYVPSEAEERYRKAQEKLEEIKEKSTEKGKKLYNQYDALIEERNDIIRDIADVSDEDKKDSLVSKLGRKNKEIKQFEKDKLNIS